MIEELIDEEQIAHCKDAYKKTKMNSSNLRKKIQNVQHEIEAMLPLEPETN
jgi:flagellar motor switch protein FliM